MSIYNIDMTHALVVPKPDPEQIVKTKVSYSSDSGIAEIAFFSVKQDTVTEHGTCKVVFENSTPSGSRSCPQMSFLVNARIQALKDMSITGRAPQALEACGAETIQQPL